MNMRLLRLLAEAIPCGCQGGPVMSPYPPESRTTMNQPGQRCNRMVVRTQRWAPGSQSGRSGGCMAKIPCMATRCRLSCRMGCAQHAKSRCLTDPIPPTPQPRGVMGDMACTLPELDRALRPPVQSNYLHGRGQGREEGTVLTSGERPMKH
jgi:hypothetical protein